MKLETVKVVAEVDVAEAMADVTAEAAKLIAEAIEPEVRSEVVAAVLGHAKEAAEDEVRKLLDGKIVNAKPFSSYDEQPEVLTLREYIVQQATNALDAPSPSDRSGSYGGRKSVLQVVVADMVTRHAEAELRKAIEAARNDVREKLQEVAGEALSSALERLAAGRGL